MSFFRHRHEQYARGQQATTQAPPQQQQARVPQPQPPLRPPAYSLPMYVAGSSGGSASAQQQAHDQSAARESPLLPAPYRLAPAAPAAAAPAEPAAAAAAAASSNSFNWPTQQQQWTQTRPSQAQTHPAAPQQRMTRPAQPPPPQAQGAPQWSRVRQPQRQSQQLASRAPHPQQASQQPSFIKTSVPTRPQPAVAALSGVADLPPLFRSWRWLPRGGGDGRQGTWQCDAFEQIQARQHALAGPDGAMLPLLHTMLLESRTQSRDLHAMLEEAERHDTISDVVLSLLENRADDAFLWHWSVQPDRLEYRRHTGVTHSLSLKKCTEWGAPRCPPLLQPGDFQAKLDAQIKKGLSREHARALMLGALDAQAPDHSSTPRAKREIDVDAPVEVSGQLLLHSSDSDDDMDDTESDAAEQARKSEEEHRVQIEVEQFFESIAPPDAKLDQPQAMTAAEMASALAHLKEHEHAVRAAHRASASAAARGSGPSGRGRTGGNGRAAHACAPELKDSALPTHTRDAEFMAYAMGGFDEA